MIDLFKTPGFTRIVDRLVARFQQGKALTEGRLLLKNSSPEERSAVDDLLGRASSRSTHLSLPLEDLPGSAAEIRSALEALRGPLIDHRARRAQEARAWSELSQKWQDLPWIDELLPLLKRLSGRDLTLAETLVIQTTRLLGGAPYPNVHLASLAAQITGDSHALDRGSPLGTIVLRACRSDGTSDARARREAWESLGVLIDDLSAPLLCLNLCTTEETAWINWHAERGEPFFLPWRQVHQVRPVSDFHEVFVCENPAIVSEAANRLGAKCRPLICLNGMPNSTAHALLTTFLNAGITIHLRADFDWAGLRIIDQLFQSGRTKLWRMTPVDYHNGQQSTLLKGSPFFPAWAEELALEMHRSGKAVHEEELLSHLIGDLRRS